MLIGQVFVLCDDFAFCLHFISILHQLSRQLCISFLQIFIFLAYFCILTQQLSLLLLMAQALLLQLLNSDLQLQILHPRHFQLSIPVFHGVAAFLFGRQGDIAGLLDLIFPGVQKDVLPNGVVAGLSVLGGDVFVFEVDCLVNIFGECEDLVVGVDGILVPYQVIEGIDIRCAIEENRSIRFEGAKYLSLAGCLPSVLEFYHFLLLRGQSHVPFLSLDQPLEVVLDVGEFSLHMRVQRFVRIVLLGGVGRVAFVLLGGRVLLAEGGALVGEGDGVGGVILFCSLHGWYYCKNGLEGKLQKQQAVGVEGQEGGWAG